jgi:hypothetical protein
MAATWSVWSWDEHSRCWLEVVEGIPKGDAANVLARKRQAAAKHLPSARFTMTETGKPPSEPPDQDPFDHTACCPAEHGARTHNHEGAAGAWLFPSEVTT